jgi:hypothetical protein
MMRVLNRLLPAMGTAVVMLGLLGAVRGDDKIREQIEGKWQQTDNDKNTLEFKKFGKNDGRVIVVTGDKIEGCFFDFTADDKIKLTSSGSPVWKLAIDDEKLTVTYANDTKATFKRVKK